MEKRRFRGIVLLKAGTTQADVARRLGVSRQAVHTWQQGYQRGGRQALKRNKIPGRPRRFTTEQRRKLPGLLKQGARASGFATDLWTLTRIAELIRSRFGFTLHRSHVHRIMHASGWSCQKPAARAVERDERRIQQWARVTWPALKKKPAG